MRNFIILAFVILSFGLVVTAKAQSQEGTQICNPNEPQPLWQVVCNVYGICEWDQPSLSCPAFEWEDWEDSGDDWRYYWNPYTSSPEEDSPL